MCISDSVGVLTPQKRLDMTDNLEMFLSILLLQPRAVPCQVGLGSKILSSGFVKISEEVKRKLRRSQGEEDKKKKTRRKSHKEEIKRKKKSRHFRHCPNTVQTVHSLSRYFIHCPDTFQTL